MVIKQETPPASDVCGVYELGASFDNDWDCGLLGGLADMLTSTPVAAPQMVESPLQMSSSTPQKKAAQLEPKVEMGAAPPASPVKHISYTYFCCSSR